MQLFLNGHYADCAIHLIHFWIFLHITDVLHSTVNMSISLHKLWSKLNGIGAVAAIFPPYYKNKKSNLIYKLVRGT